jgi:hypothetical protein
VKREEKEDIGVRPKLDYHAEETTAAVITPTPVPGLSQLKVGRKMVARDKDKGRCYKDLNKLKSKLEWQLLDRLKASSADVNSPCSLK